MKREVKPFMLSGTILKWIAAITMVIDHLGAALIQRILLYAAVTEKVEKTLRTIYPVCREIGRISFPIFCFFIVEGFFKTKSFYRYLLRLTVFALISEPFFDLAFFSFQTKAWNFQKLFLNAKAGQNVLFTLLLGLIAICLIDRVLKLDFGTRVLKTICGLIIAAAFMVLARCLKTDYDMWGVLAIVSMYLFYHNRFLCILGGYISLLLIDPGSIFGFLPLMLYNGEKSHMKKYFLYIFYPAHLAVLFLLGMLICNC